MRVLVVDDDYENRQMMRDILVDAGHIVSTAADGVAAMLAIREIRPDVVVLDMVMPRMSGDEVLEQLLGEALTPIAVVVISASRHVRAGRGVRFLAKPFGIEDLITAVSDAFAGSSRTRETAR